jgi:hypothetical protein
MIITDNKIISSLVFVVNEVKNICIKKNFSEGAILCSLILFDISNYPEKITRDYPNYRKHIHEIIDRIYNLIDDLKFLIDIETRYILSLCLI